MGRGVEREGGPSPKTRGTWEEVRACVCVSVLSVCGRYVRDCSWSRRKRYDLWSRASS